ncbi:hypothetical protein [Alienimonas chondri]|uniref:Uncharacterized protein n=1 Tax=Alienimonas chondri TaxID=2681879 RepID=A0ABX1VG06_9PLAN|nr:hypothetical protein [Alienimonas chondri]NNJ26480.1 hypothetical protein [Alienimonas chondri]
MPTPAEILEADFAGLAPKTIARLIPEPRPPQDLFKYPPDLRWELVRRHPVYQWGWARVKRWYESGEAAPWLSGEGDGGFDDEGFADWVALVALGRIGWNGDVLGPPVSPSHQGFEIDEVRENRGDARRFPHWGQILQTALFQLSAADRLHAGLALVTSALGKNMSALPEAMRLIDERAAQPASTLGQELNHTTVTVPAGVTPSAAAEQVKVAHEQLRNRLGLGSAARLREDKLALQLEVWDLREGFMNGHREDVAADPDWPDRNYRREDGRYRPDLAQSLSEVAASLGRDDETVRSQYEATFKAITGFDYSIDRWEELFVRPLMRTAPDEAPDGFHDAVYERWEAAREAGDRVAGSGIERRTTSVPTVGENMIGTKNRRIELRAENDPDPQKDRSGEKKEIAEVARSWLADLEAAETDRERREILDSFADSTGEFPRVERVIKELRELIAIRPEPKIVVRSQDDELTDET